MFELKIVTDFASVPVPIDTYAVLFVGLDGRMRARLNGGHFVDVTAGTVGADGPKGDAGAPGAAGAKGDAGAPGVAGAKGDAGAPGVAVAKGDTGAAGEAGAKGDTGAAGADGLSRVHVQKIGGLNTPVAGLAAGTLVHTAQLAADLIAKTVEVDCVLELTAASNTNVNFQIRIGNLLIGFSSFVVNGTKQVRFDCKISISATGQVFAFATQGLSNTSATMALVGLQASSMTGSLSGGAVSLYVQGAVTSVVTRAAGVGLL